MKRECEICTCPGRDARSSLLPVPVLALPGSLPLGKLLVLGAGARGHPWVLSLQLPLGLLLFNVDTSLHPLHARQVHRADDSGGGEVRGTSVLTPTCLVTLDL